MGGKGEQGAKQPLVFGGGGGGGGGKKNPYSGGAKNVGFWSPGGGKVPSYDKGGSDNDKPGRQQGGGGGEIQMPSMSKMAAKALGTAMGTLAGGVALGGPGAMYGGYKGYQSAKEGWIGDVMNARTNESARDRMESKGISRSDTALASKHGVAESFSSSLLDEGEDYDSITGEIF